MTPAGRPLSVGIIGTGWVATARHIPAFQRDSRVRVEALMDPRPERAHEAARRFGIPRAYAELRAFLDHGLDVVAICTPPWTHAPLAIEALGRGCHVMVEKPMAMSTGEARKMAGAAQEAGLALCVAHNFLFSRSMRRAVKLLECGDVGETQHAIALQLSSPRRRLPAWYSNLPGGLFFDEAPHMIYLLRRFLGDLTVGQTRAQPAPPAETQSLDRIEAALQAGQRSAQLCMSFRSPVSEWLLTVVGTRQVLVLDVFRDLLVVHRSDGAHGAGEVLGSSLRVLLQGLSGFVTSGALFSARRLLYGHETLVRGFIDSLVEGAPPPVRPEDGIAVLGTMEAILEQAGLQERHDRPSGNGLRTGTEVGYSRP